MPPSVGEHLLAEVVEDVAVGAGEGVQEPLLVESALQ
jgi:hypothetical protein